MYLVRFERPFILGTTSSSSANHFTNEPIECNKRWKAPEIVQLGKCRLLSNQRQISLSKLGRNSYSWTGVFYYTRPVHLTSHFRTAVSIDPNEIQIREKRFSSAKTTYTITKKMPSFERMESWNCLKDNERYCKKLVEIDLCRNIEIF